MKKLILILCACLLPSLAFADDMMAGRCRMGMMGTMERGAQSAGGEDMFFHKAFFILSNSDEIGLSDEQIDNIKKIKMRVIKNTILREAEIDAVSLDLAGALQEENPDQKTVQNLLDKKYDMKKQKASEIIKGYMDMKNILSKDQTKKLKDIYKGKGRSGRQKGGRMTSGSQEVPEGE